MTKFSEFLHEINRTYQYKRRDWRFGQTCFNVLWDMHELIAREINMTELDPFFDDFRVPEFLAKVRDYFDE